MDKNILDRLIQFGLVTNIGVDAERYEDVDDLINKGVITIPGARSTIERLLKDIEHLEIIETPKISPEIANTIETITEQKDDEIKPVNDSSDNVIIEGETGMLTAEVDGNENTVSTLPVIDVKSEADDSIESATTTVEEAQAEEEEEPVKKTTKKSSKKTE